MSYNISSSSIKHPLIKPILVKLTEFFSGSDIQFYVIGATARDIIMNIHGEKVRRATRDLDIAIAISDWDAYEQVEKGIIQIDGFVKHKNQKQRFIYEGKYQLDIVPFGNVMKEGDRIFWPPDESVAMSVLGFKEVGQSAKEISIDNEITIKVASLEGVFILKLVAWVDRNFKHNRDADDLGFILNNYLSINQQRAVKDHYEEIYLIDEYTPLVAGAKLIGIDVAKIISGNKKAKSKLTEIIQHEINEEENSRLINQLIETNKSFKYEEIIEALKNIIAGINLIS
jgi:predicted nucleotidyltransferase